MARRPTDVSEAERKQIRAVLIMIGVALACGAVALWGFLAIVGIL